MSIHDQSGGSGCVSGCHRAIAFQCADALERTVAVAQAEIRDRNVRPVLLEPDAAGADAMTIAGVLVAAEALQPVETATTVRVRNGRLSVVDGPFAETKEQLAGFYLIEAHDLNDAIAIAGKIPPARAGCVEVRPVRDLSPE